jgi:glycosyltransferase involved in cell wall biosynthesis
VARRIHKGAVRIAQIAPLVESVPPKLYGGTERVVSYLTEELVRQGHDVTLFASGDSDTRAELVACAPRALRLDDRVVDQIGPLMLMMEKVASRAPEFDVLHFHVDYFHFPWSRRGRVPHVTTLHGRLDLPDLVPLHREFPNMPLVSISNAQRRPLPWLDWRRTVYHGLPSDRYVFRAEPERNRYLVFVGRTSPEKRLDRAIEIARRSGLPLKIAAKVDAADRSYFDSTIVPLLDQPGIEFLGEVDEPGKIRLMAGAVALLFPIAWPEPFGLVMTEAMACGTPVIATPRGSVLEVIDEGITGTMVRNMHEAVEAVSRVASFDRRRVRQRFEERFDVSHMAEAYLGVYDELIMAGDLPVVESREDRDRGRGVAPMR